MLDTLTLLIPYAYFAAHFKPTSTLRDRVGDLGVGVGVRLWRGVVQGQNLHGINASLHTPRLSSSSKTSTWASHQNSKFWDVQLSRTCRLEAQARWEHGATCKLLRN